MDTKNYEQDNKISKILPDDLSDISLEELQLLHFPVGNADIPNQTKPPDEATSITNQSYVGIERTTSKLGISPAAAFAELELLEKLGLLKNSGCTKKIWNYEATLEGPALNLPNYQSKDIKMQKMVPLVPHIGSTMHWETHPKPGISNAVSSTPFEPTISNPTSFRNFASYVEDSNMNPKYFQASDKQGTVCQRTTGSSIRDFQNSNADGFTHFYGEDARSSYGQVSQNFASHVEDSIMNPVYFQASDNLSTVCQRTTSSSMQKFQNYNADGFTHFYEEDARSLHGQVFVEAKLNSQSRVNASIKNFILPSHIRRDLNLLSTSLGTSNEQMEVSDETNTSMCDLREKTKRNLVSHNLIRHGVKCSECEERFYDDSYLQKHMRFHSEERLFECSKCKKRFMTKGNLNSHYLTHFRYTQV